MSIITCRKPVPAITLPDWHCHVWALRQDADSRSHDAFVKRHEGKQLRNETTIKTKWDTYLNDIRLSDRILEIQSWRDVLSRCLGEVERELCKLTEEKAHTEMNLEKVSGDFAILNECLTLRDCRQTADMVLNGVHWELMNELHVLESVKSILTIKAQTAWEQINRLKEVQFMLNMDVRNKGEVICIDQKNLQMNKESANISYKPDPLRQPANMVSYSAWTEAMRQRKSQGEIQTAAGVKLREAMEAARMRAENDVLAQHEATDYAFRNRIYQVQRAKNELEWQRRKTVQEMERVRSEICAMEEALRMKVASLMLAETRMENRLMRPSLELVRDDPQAGLADEVKALRHSNNDLQEKLDRLKATYNGLESLLLRLDAEITSKQHALALDMRCLDVRKAFYTGERAPPPSQTDRNVTLVRMEDEIPRV